MKEIRIGQIRDRRLWDAPISKRLFFSASSFFQNGIQTGFEVRLFPRQNASGVCRRRWGYEFNGDGLAEGRCARRHRRHRHCGSEQSSSRHRHRAPAEAGKIIVCEKPMCMNMQEAEEMAAAVEKAGVPNMVSFNYRRVPAVSLAKQLIDENRIGRPFHYNAIYDQDYTISQNVPMGGAALWRLDSKVAGSGVTGDLLAHSIDLAEWLNGPIARVTAKTEIFVKERMHIETGKMEKVTIDDACAFIAVFQNGSFGTFHSTRYARGRKNHNTFELNGENGAVYSSLECPHALQFFRYRRPGNRE